MYLSRATTVHTLSVLQRSGGAGSSDRAVCSACVMADLHVDGASVHLTVTPVVKQTL